jgi:hypothetical protein
MHENRISELFAMTNPPNLFVNVSVSFPPNIAAANPGAAMAANLLQLVSAADIYQMAAARARYDHELDKLFNPEYYGDGSGI